MTATRHILSLGLAALVTSCSPAVQPPTVVTATPFYCPVTLANGETPTIDISLPAEASSNYHGNGSIFTILWPEGVVVFRPGGPGAINPDGSLAMKWPWWRTVEGPVTIDATRLDAPAPTMQTVTLRGPEDGYGKVGFHPSSLLFPTPGCWEITARVQDSSMTFVILVVRLGPSQ